MDKRKTEHLGRLSEHSHAINFHTSIVLWEGAIFYGLWDHGHCISAYCYFNDTPYALLVVLNTRTGGSRQNRFSASRVFSNLLPLWDRPPVHPHFTARLGCSGVACPGWRAGWTVNQGPSSDAHSGGPHALATCCAALPVSESMDVALCLWQAYNVRCGPRVHAAEYIWSRPAEHGLR